MKVHAYNPCLEEMKTGGSEQVGGQPGWQSDQVRLSNGVKVWLQTMATVTF